MVIDDPFLLLLSGWFFLVYASICLVSLIFTISLEAYEKIDSLVKIDLLSKYAVNFFDRNIYLIDDWLKQRHRIIGPFLIMLSLFDLHLSFILIRRL